MPSDAIVVFLITYLLYALFAYFFYTRQHPSVMTQYLWLLPTVIVLNHIFISNSGYYGWRFYLAESIGALIPFWMLFDGKDKVQLVLGVSFAIFASWFGTLFRVKRLKRKGWGV